MLDYVIKINDYKPNLKNLITDISFTDKAGNEADELSFTIIDANNYTLPEDKGKLEAWLGWVGKLEYLGQFTIDQVKWSGSPDKISISASGGSFASPLNEPHSIAYNPTSLGNVVEIAGGFTELPCLIHPDFYAKKIPYTVQNQETPIAFLTKLAQEYGAIFSIKNGKIIFTKKGYKPNGAKIYPLKIKKSQVSNFDFSLASREKRITGVKARWQNMQTGQSGVALAGKEGYCHTLPLEYPEARAQELANAKFAELSAIKANANIDLVKGDLGFWAGAQVELVGFKKALNGIYNIKQASHNFSNSGFLTSLELETA